MTQSTAHAIPPIALEAGSNFFQQKLGGVKLIACLIELIKNCFDWKTSNIWILIHDDYIQIIDNGTGMVAANRNAFCSMAKTTGGQNKQTSKFGTGSKDMLYISNGVTVTTRTNEGPEVIQFSLSTANYQDQLFAHENIIPRILKEKDWAVGFPTGTILHYDFKGLASIMRKLKKPSAIAAELSQKLPKFAMDAILLNGAPLPKKEIEANEVVQTFFHEQLGEVSIELYTLKGGTRSNDGVFLSSTGFSEVSMVSFRNLIPEHLRPHIPEVFLNTNKITGAITCSKLFGKYIQDGRTAFNAEIADSELLPAFIKMLNDKEHEINTYLELNQTTELGNVEDLMDQVLNLSEEIHGEEFDTPIPPREQGDKVETEPQALRILGTARDYQVGDKVELTALINPELCNAAYSDITWLTTNSGLKNIKTSRDNKMLTGIAEKLGYNTISIKAGMQHTQTSYRIVSEKVMYLSAQEIYKKPLFVGESYELTVYNVGLADGPLQWSIAKGKDKAKLAPFGETKMMGKAKIICTEAGELVIAVKGRYKDGRNFEDYCTIRVIRPETRLLKILDHKFQVFCQQNPNEKAIRMQRGAEDAKNTVHQLYANVRAKIWQHKDAKKSLLPTLMLIAQEYARFFYEDIQEQQLAGGQLTAHKLEQLSDEVIEGFSKRSK